MSKYLIVNSDDFGISEAVSKGILEGHHQGIVTSTTTMINMPAAAEAIRQALHTAPNLGLGLHFTLSFGQPVLPPKEIPSLVTEDGTFVTSFDDLIAKMPTFITEDLERELTAQFERFVALAGRVPDHLDSHHACTYFHPMAFEVMLKLATIHNLPIRWQELGGLEQQLQAQFQTYGQPRYPDHFLNPIFNFNHADRLAPLQTCLTSLPEGYSEMMVHVGYGQDLAEAYNFQRDEELVAITHPSIKNLIHQEEIQLVTFAELPLSTTP